MGQGQPRVIIWTTLVELLYTMLHTKFQGHWSIDSGVEDFLRFLPYMGMATILVVWPGRFEQLFVPPTPGGYIWNLVTIGLVVSEEKSFEIIDGRRRRTKPAYYISSPGAFGSGELKINTAKSTERIVSEIDQGPVVQSIVSFTSSLRDQIVKCFTTL